MSVDCKELVLSGVRDVLIGSLADTLDDAVSLGATSGGVTVAVEGSYAEIMVDQSVMPVRKILTEQHINLTIPLAQITPEQIALAMGQVAEKSADGNKISMSPNHEQYYQVWLPTNGVVKADGTLEKRTYHFPKVSFGGAAELALTRDANQTLELSGSVVACPDEDGNISPFEIIIG